VALPCHCLVDEDSAGPPKTGTTTNAWANRQACRVWTRRARSALKSMRARFCEEPLADSPEYPRCSLMTICLPDEVQFLHRGDSHHVRWRCRMTKYCRYLRLQCGCSIPHAGRHLTITKRNVQLERSLHSDIHPAHVLQWLGGES